MQLTVKNIAALIGYSEDKVIQMAENRELPAYRIGNQFRFNKTEIQEWLLKNNIAPTSRILDLTATAQPVSLTKLLERGGIIHDLPGATPIEAIKQAVAAIPLPAGIERDEVVFSLLDREEMMPTAIGNGIAIPHPRTPIITDVEFEQLSLCLLHDPVEFGAIDGQPVTTLFVLLSATPSRHLEILARLSFLCHRQGFMTLLRNRATADDLRRAVAVVEDEWAARGKP